MEASPGDTTTPVAPAVPASSAGPQTTALPAPTSTNLCPFLRLPAELRNRIYRNALLTERRSQTVTITKNTVAQPGLIRTCRQIRREAKLIYYLENRFKVDAENFDCSLVKFFFKQVEGHWSNYGELVPEKDVKFRVTFDFGRGDELGGRQGLANVMAWLRAYYVDEVPALKCEWCDGTEICCAASKMCEVVTELGRLPWKAIVNVIAIVKAAAEEQAYFRWRWEGFDELSSSDDE